MNYYTLNNVDEKNLSICKTSEHRFEIYHANSIRGIAILDRNTIDNIIWLKINSGILRTKRIITFKLDKKIQHILIGTTLYNINKIKECKKTNQDNRLIQILEKTAKN